MSISLKIPASMVRRVATSDGEIFFATIKKTGGGYRVFPMRNAPGFFFTSISSRSCCDLLEGIEMLD